MTYTAIFDQYQPGIVKGYRRMEPTWQTEGIELYLGDCRDVLAALPDESIDMIWTDPPYGHGNMDGDLQAARVRDGVKGARVRAAEPIANDKGPEFDAILDAFVIQAQRLLKHDCCCCCCCGGGGPTPMFAKVAQALDDRLEFFHAVVWDKSARGDGMGWRYRRNYEFVMVAHRKGGKLLWNADAEAVPNVLRHMPVRERKHPNEKPLSLVVDMIRWHSREGDMVCDPFAGSGTTVEACIRLGRNVVAIEQDERHFATMVRRTERAIANGRLFEPPPAIQKAMFEEGAV